MWIVIAADERDRAGRGSRVAEVEQHEADEHERRARRATTEAEAHPAAEDAARQAKDHHRRSASINPGC
jgi:hypothetical protein